MCDHPDSLIEHKMAIEFSMSVTLITKYGSMEDILTKSVTFRK